MKTLVMSNSWHSWTAVTAKMLWLEMVIKTHWLICGGGVYTIYAQC